MESKGTWIGINGANGRFVCVLNFHEWRLDEQLVCHHLCSCGLTSNAEAEEKPLRNRSSESTEIKFKSRGTMVSDFLHGTKSPRVHVESLAEDDLRQYRGFNLIVRTEEDVVGAKGVRAA